jgi:hypothetical protein
MVPGEALGLGNARESGQKGLSLRNKFTNLRGALAERMDAFSCYLGAFKYRLVHNAPLPFAQQILSHHTERSILDAADTSAFVPYAVAGRMRRATCSGVSWFKGYHLAVVNLYGHHLRIYRFHVGDGDSDGRAPRLELLHEVTENIVLPECVSVSPDGKWLAVTHSPCDGFGVTLFVLDPESFAPVLRETLRSGSQQSCFHCATFSPDSRFLLFTEITKPGYLEVVRLDSPSRERTCFIENQRAPLKQKGIAVSRDGRYVAVAYGLNGTPHSEAVPSGGAVAVHRFDPSTGIVEPDVFAEWEAPHPELASADMCTFLPRASGDPYRILVVDQSADAIPSFEFHAKRRIVTAAGNFATGLDFPHDVDISADARFAAITNYGDDTLRIARVARAMPQDALELDLE